MRSLQSHDEVVQIWLEPLECFRASEIARVLSCHWLDRDRGENEGCEKRRCGPDEHAEVDLLRGWSVGGCCTKGAGP
jgi:hypothetical protein